MSDVSRIFVVEGDEGLNRNLVNTLRKDGYHVQGVTNGTDAVRALWSEEFDVIICEVKTPGADGFEVLQWLRAYRPNARIILMSDEPDVEIIRTQALENGASSYLEKPLDLRLLKEELRRLLQQTGFSANLDSFDLLDVIQIVNMSRRNIALLVNTGLEERGILRFQNGELIWAEYGALQGEEAFFALAAHKNGTVLHQPWNGHVISNVTQPLSRLIFQALQYRTKYAHAQQYSGELQVVPTSPLLDEDGDEDRPFVFSSEEISPLGMPLEQSPVGSMLDLPPSVQPLQPAALAQDLTAAPDPVGKEWWELTGSYPVSALQNGNTGNNTGKSDNNPSFSGNTASMFPLEDRVASGNSEAPQLALPSWLTDQPTSSAMPAIGPVTPLSPNISPTMPMSPVTPIFAETDDVRSMVNSAGMPLVPPMPSSPEWQAPYLPPAEQALAQQMHNSGVHNAISTEAEMRRAPLEWQAAEQSGPMRKVTDLQNSAPMLRVGSNPSSSGVAASMTGNMTESGPLRIPTTTGNLQRVARHPYNYSALVSALQTLGYSVAGFVAAAVVSLDGQPIAQVAVEDLDISRVCKQFSIIVKNVGQSLGQEQWGAYEHLVLTSTNRYILMRMVGGESAFQVLITTRDTDPNRSLEMMLNVEGAINTAFQ
jgi:DNA-binding response OmpR family regulator/predicted regulator of Ras-like GTPase activity (Roadblock/LC7/MglB family)